MKSNITTIQVKVATRKRLRQTLGNTDFMSYDEWINAQLDKSKQLDKIEKKK